MLKYSVGLDVSSKDIHACISAIDEEQNVKVISSKVINNTSKGFEILIIWVEKNRKNKSIPLVIGMEATGIYHEECAYYLYDKKYSVCIVLPNQAKKYLQFKIGDDNLKKNKVEVFFLPPYCLELNSLE